MISKIKNQKSKIKNYIKSKEKAPDYLRKNHRHITIEQRNQLIKSLEENFYTNWRSKDSFTGSSYEIDLSAHVDGRLESDRNLLIPWICKHLSIKGSCILEVGCGTGASTIAMAEQGASVTAADIDTGALAVARDRQKIYGLDNINIIESNGDDAESYAANAPYDVIILVACVEHMTLNERLSNLSGCWDLLKEGGHLIITDTPNRLWHHDSHTSFLDFFHWLPDDLAFYYSKFSPRDNFSKRYRNLSNEDMEHFYRRGRGVSFHEFELAIDRIESLNVVGNMHQDASLLRKLAYPRKKNKYRNTLKTLSPTIPDAFFEENLDLIIRK